jgi:hypothetical protein
MHPNAKNLTGMRFGKLLVLRETGRRYSYVAWLCRCECGTEKEITSHCLLRGTSSCGCLIAESNRDNKSKHGMRNSPEYTVWKAVKARCFGKAQSAKPYRDRGITVCQRWANREGFAAFLEDMGPRPSLAHTIDRIDNDGNYSCGKCTECVERDWPANCRWATPTQQGENRSNNRWISAFGKTQILERWAQESGIEKAVIWSRLRAGWPPERAVSETREPHPNITDELRREIVLGFDRGELLIHIAERLGINRQRVHHTLKEEIPGFDAVKTRRERVTLPAVLRRIRELGVDGHKPTFAECSTIGGFAGLLRFHTHAELVAIALDGAHGDAATKRERKKGPLFGADNPSCKLTTDQVLAIRAQLANGNAPKENAASYSVSTALINAIAQRKVWRHV